MSSSPPAYDDLVAALASGEKPKPAWKLGVEHEKFGFRRADLSPLAYEGEQGIRAMFDYMARFGWQPVMENGKPIALADGQAETDSPQAAISLEPGGQFELSGRPLATVHENCNETQTHLAQVKEAGEALDIGFLGLGFCPHWRRDEMPVMPKARYDIMRDYMPKRGSMGLDMMHRTCTMQVNLDFASEADMRMKMRAGLSLQPLATALFANSPLVEGKPAGWLSQRARVWHHVDPDRTGMLPFVFEEGFGYERYVDYALDVPMYFIRREGRYINARATSFRRFLDKGIDGLPEIVPSMQDWRDHLTTLFPEVRLKHFIEMRGADGGHWDKICALPAFWAGLLYDEDCLQAAWDEVKHWTSPMRQQARHDAAKWGLKAKIGKESLQQLAQRILAIARTGLVKRKKLDAKGRDESLFLEPLEVIAETGITPAETLLANWQGKWQQKPEDLFADCAY